MWYSQGWLKARDSEKTTHNIPGKLELMYGGARFRQDNKEDKKLQSTRN